MQLRKRESRAVSRTLLFSTARSKDWTNGGNCTEIRFCFDCLTSSRRLTSVWSAVARRQQCSSFTPHIPASQRESNTVHTRTQRADTCSHTLRVLKCDQAWWALLSDSVMTTFDLRGLLLRLAQKKEKKRKKLCTLRSRPSRKTYLIKVQYSDSYFWCKKVYF